MQLQPQDARYWPRNYSDIRLNFPTIGSHCGSADGVGPSSHQQPENIIRERGKIRLESLLGKDDLDSSSPQAALQCTATWLLSDVVARKHKFIGKIFLEPSRWSEEYR